MPIERTVFISYRRTNFPWALNVQRDLASRGYDVFLDYNGIASGDFERVIVGNIRARAHFLVILTPSALIACDRPGDWLRREIECALEARRNIIPLMLEGFDFGSPSIAAKLTGQLAALQRYNALEIPTRYFDDAMRHLDEWLNVPVETVLHPLSSDVQHATRQQQQAASTAPPVQTSELTTQVQFERGFVTEPTVASEPGRATKEDFELAGQLAAAPLFGAAEQAMLKTLPPERQAIATLEARKEREKLIAAFISERMAARYESYKRTRDRMRNVPR